MSPGLSGRVSGRHEPKAYRRKAGLVRNAPRLRRLLCLQNRGCLMRTFVFTVAAVTAISVTPALAQGCGMMRPSQQTTAEAGRSGPSAAGTGMMCGAARATGSTQATPSQPSEQAQGGGCPCCRNMAMMMMRNMPMQQGQQGIGSPRGMQHQMPGMSTPSTPSAPPSSPSPPETPRPQ